MRAQGLTLSYAGRAVLTDLTFELRRGATTAVIGVNGCGKSTLLRALAGLHAPSAGTLTGPAQSPPIVRRRELAYLPQRLPDQPALSVREFVIMSAGSPTRWFPSQEATQRAQEALELLQLNDLSERLCATLSGGEYRRVALAACFAQGARWLVLDEPCAGLDLHQASRFMGCVRTWLKAQRDRGVVVVVHDLNLCAQYADECLLIDDGTLQAQGPADELLRSAALETAYGSLQRFRHPQRDHLVILGEAP